MNSLEGELPAAEFPAAATMHPVLLGGDVVQEMRRCLHELANVFTGVMIAGGMLCQRLEREDQRGHAAGICQDGERGAALVRQLRGQLVAASGELPLPEAEPLVPRGGELETL